MPDSSLTPPSPPDGVASALLDRAAEDLRRGQVIGYPTETVWGLAVLPQHAQALYTRKGRGEDKPLQLSCLTAEVALALAQPDPVLDALSVFWPGPLTVVTAARPAVVREWGQAATWLAPAGLVGLRVPDHALASALLAAAGGVLATTSLNPSGQPAALTLAQARAYGLADLLLATGEASGPDLPDALQPSALPSTVVQLAPQRGAALQILRQGALGQADLERALRPWGITTVIVEARA